uniref:peptidylprolyl isomerase n=1 Tax=Chaetoceros debilis TaxID=122233 RepID=A0A7S3VBF0_9STRA
MNVATRRLSNSQSARLDTSLHSAVVPYGANSGALLKSLRRTGKAKLMKGDFEGAKIDFQQAIKIDGRNSDLRKNLEKCNRRIAASKIKTKLSGKEEKRQDENISTVIMDSVNSPSGSSGEKDRKVPAVVQEDVFKTLYSSGLSKMNDGFLVEAKVDLVAAYNLDNRNMHVLQALTKLKKLEVAEKKKNNGPSAGSVNDRNKKSSTGLDEDQTHLVSELYYSGMAKMRQGSLVEANADLMAALKIDKQNSDVKKALAQVKRMEMVAQKKKKVAAQNNGGIGSDSSITIVESSHPSAVTKTLEVLRQDGGIVVIEIAKALFLISAPTRAACRRLRKIKGNTDFGFCIGNVDAFFNILKKSSLPSHLQKDPKSLAIFHPSHLNVLITKDESFNTHLAKDGSIEGFITNDGSPIREFFKEIESGLVGYNDARLLKGKEYSAPLITSANVYHKGTVKEYEEAKAFITNAGVSLGVRFKSIGNRNGHLFSVFKLRRKEIQIIRRGEMHQEIGERGDVKSLRSEFVKHVLDALDLMSGDRTISSLFKVFTSIDTDGSGFLERNEFEQFIVRVDEQSEKGKDIQRFSEDGFDKDIKKKEKRQHQIDANALFNAIDFNGDGKLSFEEFIHFVESAHKNGCSPQMQNLQDSFVRNFRRQVNATLGSSDEEKVLDPFIRVFNAMDKNKDNTISKAELRQFLDADYPVDKDYAVEKEKAMSYLELDVLFAFLDKDHSDDLTFDEIFQYMEECININIIEKKAAALFAKNDFREAAQIYEKNAGYSFKNRAVTFEPGDNIELSARTLSNAAICHIKLSEWKLAHRCADTVLDIDGDFERLKALYCRGVANLNMGYLIEAKLDLKAAYDADNGNAEVRESLSKLKQIEATLSPKGFDDDDDEDKTHQVSQLYNSGISKMNAGSLAEAKEDLMAAFGINSENANVRGAIAKLKQMQRSSITGKNSGHVFGIVDGLNGSNTDEFTRNEEAYELYCSGMEKLKAEDLSGARADLKAAFNLDRDDVDIRKALATVRERQFVSKRNNLNAGDENDQSDEDGVRKLLDEGNMHIAAGSFDKAKKALLAAFKIDSKNLDVRKSMGLLAEKENAKKTFQPIKEESQSKLLRTNSTVSKTLNNLRYSNTSDRMKSIYITGNDILPDSSPGTYKKEINELREMRELYESGMAKMKRGSLITAKAAFKASLSFDEGNPDVKRALKKLRKMENAAAKIK